MNKFKFFRGGGIFVWSNITFSMVSRIFQRTVFADLASIQPMGAPTGMLFYSDYSYSNKLKQNSFKFFRGYVI